MKILAVDLSGAHVRQRDEERRCDSFFFQGYVRQNACTPSGTIGARAAQLGNNAALPGAMPLFEQEYPLVR
jgi:hypothetical protein